MKEIESLRPGMLLVATPDLRDPHFRRTVVYLVAHGSDGTVGVILNRPSETAVQNVLPTWASHTSRPHAVFAGGPVQTSAAMCLGVCRNGTNPREVDGVVGVTGPVVLVDLDADPGCIRAHRTRVSRGPLPASGSPGRGGKDRRFARTVPA